MAEVLGEQSSPQKMQQSLANQNGSQEEQTASEETINRDGNASINEGSPRDMRYHISEGIDVQKERESSPSQC